MQKNLTKLLLNMLVLISTLSLLEAAPVRIMPLGDSITFGVQDEEKPKSTRTGYRAPLWYKLKNAKYKANFVGSMNTGSSAKPTFDSNHEGHPGWTSYDIAEKLYGYLSNAKPDIILLHIGSNDHRIKIDGLVSILNEIDTYEKNSGKSIRVIVAKIINRSRHDLSIDGYNHNLEIIVRKRWAKGDKLSLVDMKDAKLTKKDYSNNTHPNKNGYTKIANVWFKEITTDYVEYTSAPITKNDIVEVNTGSTVHIGILTNDQDIQNDMNTSSVLLSKKKNTPRSKSSKKLRISGQGTWKVNDQGIVTFTPKKNFTADPTPIYYTLKDKKNELSKPAKISIDYTNTSLESYPTSLVDKSYIESISINESSNSVKFITAVPDNGITF